MGVQAALGGHVVWHSEVDEAASKVLAYRYPGVPNLGDITRIDWAGVPAVDVLCGGFPCQDVSAAGKRAGIHHSTRSGLWSYFADAIDVLQPALVIIENVRGLLSATAHRDMEFNDPIVGNGSGRPVLRAAGAVLGDLATLGYDAQWTTLAAADVGAPHRRERVFILAADAASAGARDNVGRLRGLPKQSPSAADAPRDGRDEGRPESARLVGGFDAAVSGDGHVDLLPTPCVVDRLATTDMTLEQWDESRRSQKERGVGSFGPRGDSLGAAVLRVEEGSERPDYSTTGARQHSPLLPTPNAQDGGGPHGDRGGWRPSRGHRQSSLSDALTAPDYLLPTPNAQDGNGGGRYSSDGHQSTLPGEVRLLPTPRSSDCFGAGQHGDGGMDLRTTVSLLPAMSAQWGKYAPAIARWEQIVGPAPAPTEPNRNGKPRLNPEFSSWMMGWPAGWVTDPAIGISRNDQLRIIGNGVCPHQAHSAIRQLTAIVRLAIPTNRGAPNNPEITRL